jgi:hypothetical protein
MSRIRNSQRRNLGVRLGELSALVCLYNCLVRLFALLALSQFARALATDR